MGETPYLLRMMANIDAWVRQLPDFAPIGNFWIDILALHSPAEHYHR